MVVPETVKLPSMIIFPLDLTSLNLTLSLVATGWPIAITPEVTVTPVPPVTYASIFVSTLASV